MNAVCPQAITRRCFLQKSAKTGLALGLSPLMFDVGQAQAATRRRDDFEPAYLKLHESGELARRADELWALMKSCRLCPRRCGVNRHSGMSGVCQAPGTDLVIASFHPHFGEERPLVGQGGSGTVFFSHCNLRCAFCQNYDIALLGRGDESSVANLARMMRVLQTIGCHNINLVTPTHYSAHILKAIDIAAGQGLRLPIVYNTSGWERIEILELLDGVVDIYLPDFKYWDGDMSAKYSSDAASYPEMTAKAILEMQRQVGVAIPPAGSVSRSSKCSMASSISTCPISSIGIATCRPSILPTRPIILK